MAQGEASSGLTLDELHAVLANLSVGERKFLGELVAKGTSREAMVVTQLFHHFPGARLVSDDTLGSP